VAQIVSVIVKHAVESRASDIHIEPFENGSRVRYRIDGVLQTVLTLPLYIHDSVISRIKVLSNLKIDETRVPQDGRFKFETADLKYDLRVSIMPLSGREKATLRVLDIATKALALEQLGFIETMRLMIDKAAEEPFGMVLVTGPTGSGKSTTLFSILSKLNDEGVNITTLEDPIEYNIPGINQAQIRPEVKFTFASGLRALMRQDPDVIMVGEIRDNETAEMAVHAALTGHMLFSTLHTNDALGAIPRLMDMKVEPFLLASTLTLIVAQRLSRRICSKCKEQYELPPDAAKRVREILAGLAPNLLPAGVDLNKLAGWRGKGCPLCKNTGYSGRVVAAETLPISEKMRGIIANGFKQEEVKKELERSPMITLAQDGVIKALQGITTLEEVMRVSKEEKEQE
jgi:type IV pilus assembly protein PilB